MSVLDVTSKFSAIGARVKERTSRSSRDTFRLDVKRDDKGQFFELINTDKVSLSILDMRPDDRHLVLMAAEGRTKMRFLCGHDEREWFTCAVPGFPTTVLQAKQALKGSRTLRAEIGIKTKEAHKRRRRLPGGGKLIRQGEFTFIPMPNFQTSKNTVIHQNEPMSRGAGKPHMAEYLIRDGGTVVYSNGKKILTPTAYNKLSPLEKRDYRQRVSNARVLAKGRIRHPDHATVYLGDTWHAVEMNTEQEATGSRNVAFID